MSNIRRGASRAIAGGAAAALLVVSSAVATAAPAVAAEGFEFHRLAGPDRYATAAAIARATFTTSSTVLLANGQSDDRSTVRNEGHFPDALAASYLAGARNAPTLLTMETALPSATRQALRDLQATTVVIIGGESAVSAGQAQQLRDGGYSVQRIGGETRYDTAAAVAATPAVGYVGTVEGRRTAVVASGVNFPDALVAGPLGYASKLPVLITEPQRLSAQTSRVLRALDIRAVLVTGGTTAVSESVASQIRDLGIVVQRFSGANRSDTAARVAEYSIAKLGFTDDHVNVALGTEFADALTGGPHAGRDRAPILLTASQDEVGLATRTFLENRSDTLLSGHILGGPAAVGSTTERDAQEAATGEPSADADPDPNPEPEPRPDTATVTLTSSSVEQGGALTGSITGTSLRSATVTGCGLTSEPVEDTASIWGIQFVEIIPAGQPLGGCTVTFTVTFQSGTTQVVSRTVDVTAPRTNQDFRITPSGDQTTRASSEGRNEGRLAFTVAEVGTTVRTVDIALAPCEDSTRSGHDVVFRDADTSAGHADGVEAVKNDTPADVETVNDMPNTANLGDDEFADDVPVSNGTLTFTVDSVIADCVVAVVFADADNDDALDLDAVDEPSELFVVSGILTIQPPPAGNGIMDENVQSTDKANNRLVGCELLQALGSPAGAGSTSDPEASATDCATFTYDANDAFFLDAGKDSDTLSLVEFEALLSGDDDVAGAYSSDPAVSSQFRLFDEAPLPPEAVTAMPAATSVTLVIDDSSTPSVDGYAIYRSPTTTGFCPDSSSSLARVANVPDPSPAGDEETVSYVDTGLTPDTPYCYLVRSVDDGDESASSTTPINNGLVRTRLTSSPIVLDAELVEGPLPKGKFDRGDVVYLCVDRALRDPEEGDALQLTQVDEQGMGRLVNGDKGNATFTLDKSETGTVTVSTGTSTGAAGDDANTCPVEQVLKIEIKTAVTDSTATAVEVLAAPAVITGSSGVTDTQGRELDLVGSKDRTVDEETESEHQDLETGDPAPAFTAASAEDGTQVLTITYSKPLACSFANPGDHTLTIYDSDNAEARTVASLAVASCSGQTVVLRLVDGGQFVTGQRVRVDKVDGRQVLDERGRDQLDDDSIAFNVTPT